MAKKKSVHGKVVKTVVIGPPCGEPHKNCTAVTVPAGKRRCCKTVKNKVPHRGKHLCAACKKPF